MEKKICFVIMGFGTKKDPITNRPINLDETYKKIIRPSVIENGYTCVRADEIVESGLIDRSMFALLMRAELVIADITTHNFNAIYELGVRHAVKPYSTIILMEESEDKVPFDISHNRILTYKHLGNEITQVEAEKSIRALRNLIKTISLSPQPSTDSPLYTFISTAKIPEISDDEYTEIIKDLLGKENSVYALMEKAKKLMNERDFLQAAELWNRLNSITENELYFTQQQALCRYKSEHPTRLVALTEALTVIEKISHSNDTETLGISGAINKNLWETTNDITYLDFAIDKYKVGWAMYKDYYTGENYALCLNLKASIENDNNEKIYYEVEAKKTREKIIEILNHLIDSEDFEYRLDRKWVFATLAQCYFIFQNTNAEKLEQEFLELANSWEKDTYYKSKETLKKLNLIR